MSCQQKSANPANYYFIIKKIAKRNCRKRWRETCRHKSNHSNKVVITGSNDSRSLKGLTATRTVVDCYHDLPEGGEPCNEGPELR